MNHPQNNIKKEIESTFKMLLMEDLNQARPLVFQELLERTVLTLGVEEYVTESPEFLWDWFDQIVNHNYLKRFTVENNREIIIHSNQLLEIINAKNNEFHPIENISIEDYQLSLEILCATNNITWNYSSPFSSFFCKIDQQQYRMSLIHHSTSPCKVSKLYARRIASDCFPLQSFGIDDALENKLQHHLLKKSNIIISGSTGSGKTAFMASLIQNIPSHEHLIIMEDTHEIQSFKENHTLMLSQDGQLNKTLKSYCSYALRMSPSRLVLGEIRSSEIVPFILSMNTGHKGLISTVHANSAYDAISRLAVLFCLFSEQKEISYQLILKLICSNIDIIIQMEDCRIKEIIHVLGSDEERPIFELEYP